MTVILGPHIRGSPRRRAGRESAGHGGLVSGTCPPPSAGRQASPACHPSPRGWGRPARNRGAAAGTHSPAIRQRLTISGDIRRACQRRSSWVNASTSSSCAPRGNAASCSMKSSTHARAGRRRPVGPVGRGRVDVPGFDARRTGGRALDLVALRLDGDDAWNFVSERVDHRGAVRGVFDQNRPRGWILPTRLPESPPACREMTAGP